MSETTDVRVEPKPPKEEIVTQEVLATGRVNAWTLASGFAGISNPTTIWQQMASDSPRAYQFYRELEEKDEDVGGLLEMLKLLVLSLPHQVQPADDSAEAARAADFVREQLDAIDMHTVCDALLDAPGYGLSISEVVYDISAGQIAVKEINDCPQDLFSFGALGDPQVGPLRFMGNYYSSTSDGGLLVPEEKFLIWSYRPRCRNRRGRPLIRQVFWPSWFKRQALRMWLRFGEKGPGTAAVKYPKGATEDEQRKALAAAESIVEKIAVAVPENFALVEELLTAARSQNPAVYEKLVDRMEMSITRRILGQTLTSHGSDGGTGSFALGGVHEDILFLKVKELAGALQSVINEQLVRRLVLWNFGPKTPMPKWTISSEQPDDLSQLSIMLDRLQLMGTPIPKSYMLKKFAITESKDETDTLVRGPEMERMQRMGLPLSADWTRSKYGVPAPVSDEDTLRPLQTAAASDGGGGGLDAAQFASDVPAEIKHAQTDVDRLLGQLRSDAVQSAAARIRQLAEQVQGNVQ